ncbi:hypothetical protein ACFHW2_25575 [Actinomadura sp. LOL_016]|uniref:hypothetical protein n=1 Tax=unclassified Actinomadura TaxID=2626254 RepID=UPI003A80E181
MPFPDRARRFRTDTSPRTSRMSPTGPLAIIGASLIVLTVLWQTTAPLTAVIMAGAALLAGALLLLLMHGTGRRRRGEAGSPALWRRR